MHEKAKELVALLSEECENLEDVQALLKGLFKGTIEQMLEAEMDEHLAMKSTLLLEITAGTAAMGTEKRS